MIGSLVLLLGLVYPLFQWTVVNPSFGKLVTMQVVLCCLIGVFYGPMSTAVAEQFAVLTRSTGMGIGYNFAVMTFGGFAQFFVTWVLGATGLPTAPALYVMFGALVGLVATVLLVDRTEDELRAADPLTAAVRAA
jgi:MFS transporter, MHS family, proline/betaine transporter